MPTKAPTRPPEDIPRGKTPTLHRELKTLLAVRRESLDRLRGQLDADVLAMLRELTVIRRQTHEQLGKALGLSRTAVTMRIKPYRDEWKAEPFKAPDWPRPYAGTPTEDIVAELVEIHGYLSRGIAAHPQIKVLDGRIRAYVEELMKRQGDYDGARSRTGLGRIATEVGTSRSTLARIMGWNT